MKSKWGAVVATALLISGLALVSGCGGGSGSSNTNSNSNSNSNGNSGGGGNTSCAWHGDCSTTAPHGAYDCDEATDKLYLCNNGSWTELVDCNGTYSGAYSCTCQGGCGVTATRCQWAGDTCGNIIYETCGDNATMQNVNNTYTCVPD